MATKKTTNTTTAKKTNDSKAKKTNGTKKKVGETSVVDEFLDTVVGETFTEEDADNNENRKKEIKERWEKLGMDEGMQEEVKEIVVDMYAKQASELIKEAIGEEGEDGTPYINIKDMAETIVFPGIDTNEPNCEPNDEPNHEMTGEEAYDFIMQNYGDEVKDICEGDMKQIIEENKERVQQTQNIVYVNSAMGASWD